MDSNNKEEVRSMIRKAEIDNYSVFTGGTLEKRRQPVKYSREIRKNGFEGCMRGIIFK